MSRIIKVVIADASSDFCLLLSEAVSREPDIEIVGATGSGARALELCLEHDPDVLITDLLLPELDGVGLLRELQERERSLKTIVVSGFFNDAAASNLSRLGVNWFFPKPCSITELVHRITEVSDDRTSFITSAGNYDAEISEALIAFGVMPHLRGFRLLRAAVSMTIEDSNVLRGVTKILYPDLARVYGTSSKCVERSIRNAIEYACLHGDESRRRLHFGKYADVLSNRPSNSRCISLLTEFVIRAHCRRSAGGSWLVSHASL